MIKRRPRKPLRQRAKTYGRDVFDSQADIWKMLRASGVTKKSASDTAELRRGPAVIRDPRLTRFADC
jgi:hypothetical protein